MDKRVLNSFTTPYPGQTRDIARSFHCWTILGELQRGKHGESCRGAGEGVLEARPVQLLYVKDLITTMSVVVQKVQTPQFVGW